MKMTRRIPPRSAGFRTSTRRAALIAIVVSCLQLISFTSALAQKDMPQEFNIERQPIAAVLKQLHLQTSPAIDFQYLPANAEEERILMGPLKGRHGLDVALTKLLAPVGYSYMWVDERKILIISKRPSLRSRSRTRPTTERQRQDSVSF